MKKVLSIIILATAMIACQKQEAETAQSGNNNYNNYSISNSTNTTEIPVKKYLVKEYYAGASNQPTRVIEWNEDFTRIMHITTQQNTYWQIDYSFEYNGDESMQVTMSKPDDAHAMVLFTNYTCHFDEEGRISTVDYYFNANYQSSTKYNYDESGKLVSVVDEAHNVGIRYVWEGDNVCEVYKIPTEELVYSFSGFTEYFHPDSTLPYLLEDGNGYAFWHLTEPLWKNWYGYAPDVFCEYDEDGYVTCIYRITEDGGKKAIIYYEYAQK